MQASLAVQRTFRWSAPGKPVAVELALPLVDSIAFQLAAGVQATGRAVEIGGLLLGRVRHEGGLIVTRIEDVEPIACEHVAGPSYMLSAADRQTLEARLRARKRSVVGFYRSNTRKDFAVTVEDVALMGWYFSQPSNVFLLIHAANPESLRAAFVVWQGRAMAQKTPADEFPFDLAALAAHSYAEQAPPPAQDRSFKAGWLAAAAIALGLAGGLIYDRSGTTAPAPLDPAPAHVAAAPPPNPEPPAPAPAPEIQSIAPQLPQFTAPAPVRPRAAHSADRRIAFIPPPSPTVPDAPEMDLPLPPIPTAETVALEPPVAPPPPSPHPGVSVSMSAVTRGLGPKFIPPAALREVRPDIPPHLQRRVSEDALMVRVKVYVDREGKVEYAELLSDGTGQNRDLASLAVFAARRWQFTPASRAGKPVDAQAVLRFRFGPNAP